MNIKKKKFLFQTLKELKDLFNENNNDQEIIHMLIDNHIIDYENFDNSISRLKSESLYLDARFISFPNNLIIKFNQILEKYHIKVKKIISGKYVKSFMNDKDIEISLIGHKIIKGHNRNEINIVPKIDENKGFFEKFFHLFS